MNRFFDRILGEPVVARTPAELVDDPFPASLSSCVPGSYFRAYFRANWYEHAGRPQLNRQSLQHAIVQSAEQVTRTLSVARLETAQVLVNGALQTLRLPPETPAPGLTVAVNLTADDEEVRAAQQWEKLQSRLEVQRLTAELELDRLRHLRSEVFGDPGIARTYWLDKHPERPDEVLSDRFERIAETLGAEAGPSTTQIANILRAFLTELDAEDKKTLVTLLSNLLIRHRREDLAARLPQDLG